MVAMVAASVGGSSATEIALACGFLLLGAAAIRFGAVQLRGDSKAPAFLRHALIALAATVVFTLSDHLGILFGAWLATSLAVDRLLRQNPSGPVGHLAADGKFVASRVGDLFLLAAIFVAVWHHGTWSVREIVDRSLVEGGSASLWIGILVVLSALAKSAQVPFHGWLPRTIDAPTAVSALLHAGIVNAGAVLLLKFSPLLASNLPANVLLVAIGSLTIFTGLSASWIRPDVKGALAWSTVAQMGFVMVEIGLGAYAIALLHLLGHGLYKSWAFLGSGEVVEFEPGHRAPKPDWIALRDAALAAAVMAALAIGVDGTPSLADGAMIGAVAVALGSWNTGTRRGAVSVAIIAFALECVHIASHRVWNAPAAWVVHPAWSIPFVVLPAATLLLFGWVQGRVAAGGALGQILFLPMSRGWYLDRPLIRATRIVRSSSSRFQHQPEVH